jgi:AAA+ superfamily predicted ATPase
LRLSPLGIARFLERAAPGAGEVLPATHPPIHPRAAAAAALILAADGLVWIRARSRRLARQLALDLATIHPAQRATFVTARTDEPVPAMEGVTGLGVLDLFDLDRPPRLPAVSGTIVVLAPERFEEGGRRAIDAPPLGPDEAAAVWARVRLPEAARARLGDRFRLTLPELLAAEREAQTLAALSQPPGGVPPGPADAQTLARAIRAAGARRMGPFVSTIEADVTLDDLVATPDTRRQLEDAVAWRQTDARVWGTMRLPRDDAEAHGLALLFSGPPGGGKTFAARCLANALGLNLYRIDLSQVVSKYIGETEKRLAQIFDEAEAGHGVLFFDEADAVFGKRSEVKDAHDRYANIEVGFLLQRMESFGGVVVLATNLRGNLDPAFTRRMQFIIDFPMPGRAERALLWQRNLPGPSWRDPSLDIAMLAERFRLAGGNIRNAAVAAAHLAAAEPAPVSTRHLARALYRELEKSGLPRGRADLGPLAQHVEELA